MDESHEVEPTTHHDGPRTGAPDEAATAPTTSVATYSQARLRDLVRINSELTSNLNMPRILQRIVELGKELLRARYAAIGIVGDERRIKELIHTGMDQDVVDLIGRIPQGRGLLGALINDPRPVRLELVEDDDRAAGFPPHHPRMQSFLGVPIRVHQAFYGTLYIADREEGAFSKADEELAEALAATAGIAIQNARLFDASTHRATWSAALADLARQPAEHDDEGHLSRIVEEVRKQAHADLAFIARVAPSGDVVVERAEGPDTRDLSDLSFPVDPDVIAAAATTGEAVLAEGIVPDGTDDLAVPALFGPTMILSFPRHGTSAGVLVVCREPGRGSFGSRDVEMGEAFAAFIDASSQRRELLQTRQRVAVLEDRGRIARDLHDHVIQSLFATGLNLEDVAARAEGDISTRIGTEIDAIDQAIAQIRQSIFELRHDARPVATSLRTRILQIVDHLTGQSPGTTQLILTGPVDTVISGTCRDDVAAVVTEALVNVVRHAEASKVDITVTATDGTVLVEVSDDGIGPGDGPEVSGLANLRRRAESRGGTFGLHKRPDGGTRLAWSVPI
jgi:signal transduction histidine kinase